MRHRNTNLVGKTGVANNGMKMRIIRARTAKDIDVKFEDGTVTAHKSYCNFQKGNIGHPSCKHLYERPKPDHLIGQTTTAANGMEMTIIGGTKYDDITVRFEDGTVVPHKSHYEFKRGWIRNPNYKKPSGHVGETRKNGNGMEMAVIEAHTWNDVRIRFEDGTEADHASYVAFSHGAVAHPLYPPKNQSLPGFPVGCVAIRKHAYRTDLDHYICECRICGHRDIWNWKEIHAHNALHGIPPKRLTHQHIMKHQNRISSKKTETPWKRDDFMI